MRRFITVSILFVLALNACNRVPAEYRRFLNLPLSKQHDALKRLPFDKRIDYYLAAMRYNEPPGVGLADDVAMEGKQALPALLNRLREEKDEQTQVRIIRVFEFMHARYYKLRGETEVVELVKRTTDNMKNSSCKAHGEAALKFIETDQLPNVEDALKRINSE